MFELIIKLKLLLYTRRKLLEASTSRTLPRLKRSRITRTTSWIKTFTIFLLNGPLSVNAQYSIASLSDPCDCTQNHDYWQTLIDSMLTHIQPGLRDLFFDPGSGPYNFFTRQSCIWSHSNEESHRLAALSDCIPGFVMMKISCAMALVHEARNQLQKSVKPESDEDEHYVAARDKINDATMHMAEVLRTASFGMDCLDQSPWPVTMHDIHINYVRWYRAVSYYRITETMLYDLIWVPENCKSNSDCVGGNVAGRLCIKGRCKIVENKINWNFQQQQLPGPGQSDSSEVKGPEENPENYFCPVPGVHEEVDGSCWYLGDKGESCAETCDKHGTILDPNYFPSHKRVVMMRLLTTMQKSLNMLMLQDPWMPQECYVADQNRFHTATPRDDVTPADFKDPLCQLACNCKRIYVAPNQIGTIRREQISDCVQDIRNMCVHQGVFEQSWYYHNPNAMEEGFMFRSCSEVGQTLFGFKVSQHLYPRHPEEPPNKIAFLLPVTFKLTSTWHGLHSLIAPFAMLHQDPKYDMINKDYFDIDIYLVNQDLERDVEHWNKILGYDTQRHDGRYGWFSRFLEGFGHPVYSQGYEDLNKCYKRVIFGHELMMYSSGGWVEDKHVQFFTRKMKNYFLGGGIIIDRRQRAERGEDPDALPFYRGHQKGGIQGQDSNHVYYDADVSYADMSVTSGSDTDSIHNQTYVEHVYDEQTGEKISLPPDEYLEDHVPRGDEAHSDTDHIKQQLNSGSDSIIEKDSEVAFQVAHNLGNALSDAESDQIRSAIKSNTASKKSIQTEKNWNFKSDKKLFLIQDRLPGKSFHRFVGNRDLVYDYIKRALDPNQWIIERHDFGNLPFIQQVRLASKARIMFGAHGDGLGWGLFMQPNSVLLEAVPTRRGGYQVCKEGVNRNPRGIFGGLMKFADRVTHICWFNPRSEKQSINIESDVYDWNWRMINIDIDLTKVAHWLRYALWVVDGQLSDETYERCQNALADLWSEIFKDKNGTVTTSYGSVPSDVFYDTSTSFGSEINWQPGPEQRNNTEVSRIDDPG